MSNPPTTEKINFDCPHCGTYTHHKWYRTYAQYNGDGNTIPIFDSQKEIDEWVQEVLSPIENIDREVMEKEAKQISKIWEADLGKGIFFDQKSEAQRLSTEIRHLSVSCCYVCGEPSIWNKKRLIFPPTKTAEPPHPDMPDDVKQDYEEARTIVELSPRGAAALLRLGLQKFCVHLGQPGKNIDTDIKSLVKEGLDDRIQKALDIVRVIGNESVHPGVMDLRDDRDTAMTLFEILNTVVIDRISTAKRIDQLYDKLPRSKRDGIAMRDGRNGQSDKPK